MKTLQEIKNTYAIEEGFYDWEALQSDCQHLCGEMESHMDEICIRAQKVALENAADNVWNNGGEDVEKICPSITNPENLIR